MRGLSLPNTQEIVSNFSLKETHFHQNQKVGQLKGGHLKLPGMEESSSLHTAWADVRTHSHLARIVKTDFTRKGQEWPLHFTQSSMGSQDVSKNHQRPEQATWSLGPQLASHLK